MVKTDRKLRSNNILLPSLRGRGKGVGLSLNNIIMNKIFNQLFLYLCVALFFASCNNDGDTVYVDGMAPSELIATSSDIKLDISQRAKVVLQLAWKNPTLLSSDANNPVTGDLLKTYIEASTSENFVPSVSFYRIIRLFQLFIEIVYLDRKSVV